MKIELNDSNDCPFRSTGESGGTCNVASDGLTCNHGYDYSSWPGDCPVLDEDILVTRLKPVRKGE